MGKTTEELNIRITGDSKSAKAALKRLRDALKKADDGAKRSNSLLKNFKQNWIGITAATAGMVIAVKKVVTAFAEQERQQRTLAAAMKQAGTFTEEAFQENLKFASSLQKITTFGDEAIIGVQRMLTNFGVEGKAMKGLTRATLDLAAAKGMDLKAAADLVAKSVGSSTNALTRYGIEVTGAAGSTERMEQAVENITKIFGGAAAAEADTFAGSVTQLKNIFGDLMEKMGETIVKFIKPLIGFLKTLTLILDAMPESLRILGIALVTAFTVGIVAAKLFGATLSVATGGISLLVGAVIAGTILMVQHWEDVQFAFEVAWSAIKIGLLEAAAFMLNFVPIMFAPFFIQIDLIIKAINLFREEKLLTLTEMTEDVRAAAEAQAEIEKTNLDNILEAHKKSTADKKKEDEKRTKSVQTELQKQIGIYVKELDKLKTVFNDVTKLVGASSEILVSSIIQGFEDAEVSAKAIFASIASAFIDLFSGELAVMAAKEAAKAIALAITLNPKAALHAAAAGGLTSAAVGLKALKPSIVGSIMSAAEGADFITSGPQTLVVGDNPSGSEHVRVTPSESAGFGGGEINISIGNLTVISQDVDDMTDQIFQKAEQAGARMFNRGGFN